MKKVIAFCLLINAALNISSSALPKLPPGFSYIQQIDPTIKIQARYAIPENFRGDVVKGYLRKTVIISTKAGLALKELQQALIQLGYSLLIYDAYRPQKAVDDFVAWSKAPQDNKTKAQFYPYIQKKSIIPDGYVAERSGHSRGSTVDLTLIPLSKQPQEQVELVDYKLSDGRIIKVRDDGSQFMCGHFDLFDLASHHDTTLIEYECQDKRNTLRDLMIKFGFRPLQEQWWHYTLVNQPFPNTYFDFDVY